MEAAAPLNSQDDQGPTFVVRTPRLAAVDFSAAAKEKLAQSAGESNAGVKRDWSAALDLVSEAFEAIRLADERAAASEQYQTEMAQRHAEEIRSLESRITAADRRAEAAESRAKAAEGWLSKFHDKIVGEFQRTFVSKSP